jgi:hypothetical protein
MDAGPGAAAQSSRMSATAARWALVALWTGFTVALLLHAARNLPNRGIWYDEGVQLHVSLGEDPFGPLDQPAGNLRRVRAANGWANLDPGGFSVLLHGWMRIGDDLTWVRLLPFLFLVAGTVALALLAARWSRAAGGAAGAPWLSCLAAGAIWLHPLMLLEATEARAYSLEVAGILCAFWALDRFLERTTPWRGLVAGGALATAMLARYSGFLAAFAALVATTAALARSAPPETARWRCWTRALRTVWPVAVAPAASALGVALLSGPALVSRVRWRSGELVGYLDPYLAADRTAVELLRQAAWNLLGPWGLPLTLALVLAVWSLLRRHEAPGPGLRDSRSFLVFGAAAGTLVLTAALWRYHPWDLARRWNLYLHALSVVCVLRVAAVVAVRPGWRRTAVAWVSVLALVAASARAATYRRHHADQVVDALAWLAAHPEETGTVAVAVHTLPSVRYLCERERLRGCAGWPARFELPIAGREEALAVHRGLAITREGAEAARARLAPARVEAEGLPPNLIRIVQPGD